jgi:hypothetical protein
MRVGACEPHGFHGQESRRGIKVCVCACAVSLGLNLLCDEDPIASRFHYLYEN